MALCGSHTKIYIFPLFFLNKKKKELNQTYPETYPKNTETRKKYTDTSETSHVFLRNPAIYATKKNLPLSLSVINCHGKQRSILASTLCVIDEFENISTTRV